MLVFANAIQQLRFRCSKLAGLSDCNVNGPNIVKTAKQITTDGFTGPIAFDENGDRSEHTVIINVYQYNDEAVASQVGYYNQSVVYISKPLLQWKDGNEQPRSGI